MVAPVEMGVGPASGVADSMITTPTVVGDGRRIAGFEASGIPSVGSTYMTSDGIGISVDCAGVGA